jgi:hypothetical protein
MTNGISRRYKTLMAVALVAGPLIWLLFTPDGQRRTDLVLMPLLGRPSIELSLIDLSSELGEGDIRGRLPQVDLRCFQDETPFGDRVCSARIGAIGRLPAEALSFYFSSGGLRAVKLVYRRDVQGELLASLARQLGAGIERELGADRTDGDGPAEGAARVISWPVTDGVLLLNAGDLAPGEEPALLWLSGAAVEQRVQAARTGAAAAD